MQLEDFYFLLTDEGARLLAETAATPITTDNHLQLAQQLRRQVGPTRAHAVIETVILRQRAAAKFSRAADMFFTRPALEQASAEIVSNYRARRYQQAGVQSVADLGCGIGGDAIALAAHANVTGVEWDALRLAMAQENARVYGVAPHFHPLQADLLELAPLPVEAIFADPGRRDESGRRFHSVHDYQPPLSYIDQWRATIPQAAVKISPGVDYAELPADAEVEFISVAGEVREGVLWFGGLHSGVQRRATLLPGQHSLTSSQDAGDIAITRPQAYLYEPDGAVIRAHLVEPLAAILGASKIDEDIAYLTADQAITTPFARAFVVEDTFPFQLKRLRHYLRERQIGRVTIKKRGSPLDPDTLRQRLRLPGDGLHRVLFLTHVMGQPAVIIAQPIDPFVAG